MQSTTCCENGRDRTPDPLASTATGGLHVAIIMDGNGRWATARGRPRAIGHIAGAAAVRRVVEAAPGLGIRTLSLYAFSSDNWKRPPAEVQQLLRLFVRHLRTETSACRERGVRVNVIGRRDRLPDILRYEIERAETATAGGTVLELRLAIDYSARDAIVAAASLSTPALPLPHMSTAAAMEAAATHGGGGGSMRAAFAARLGAALHAAAPVPDVDLVIRTGGEQRLSDFMLWECAYAELYFTPLCWPDFDAVALSEALVEYGRRERRFGGLEAAGGVSSPRPQ